jgi:hypothetical protein
MYYGMGLVLTPLVLDHKDLDLGSKFVGLT